MGKTIFPHEAALKNGFDQLVIYENSNCYNNDTSGLKCIKMQRIS